LKLVLAAAETQLAEMVRLIQNSLRVEVVSQTPPTPTHRQG
jgi:hypothetical protein